MELLIPTSQKQPSRVRLIKNTRQHEVRTVEEVYFYWFGNGEGKAREERWYSDSARYDSTIKHQFEASLKAAEKGGLTRWLRTKRGCLSYIILTGPMAKQMYRNVDDLEMKAEHRRKSLSAAKHCIKHYGLIGYESDEINFILNPFRESLDVSDHEEGRLHLKSILKSRPKDRILLGAMRNQIIHAKAAAETMGQRDYIRSLQNNGTDLTFFLFLGGKLAKGTKLRTSGAAKL